MEKILTTNEQFITPKIGRADRLGVSLFEDSDPVELWPGSDSEEVQIVIRAVYRQVLGNAYIMESERLEAIESQLKKGDITVKEFVRALAKSPLYRSRFFENCPRYRAIELNFKHLLGRAPESYQETRSHSKILDEMGYDAEIDSYLDSEEYQLAYGEYIVPYYRGYKTIAGKKMVGFTYMFRLLRGSSSSDKDLTQNNRARLNKSILTNTSSAVVPPSQIGLIGQVTDVQQLLAKVFKASAKPPQIETRASQEDLNLQKECREQSEAIKNLQQKLTQLRSQETIGQRQLNKWQSLVAPTQSQDSSFAIAPNLTEIPPTANRREIESLIAAQKNAIATLKSEIARLETVANIGQIRLNKWRNRTFS
ncbi:MAG: phycobilisome rod-core linker polypeptide [Prochloraceae cyanobacterium]|nr:phycobilisome rod-core linker polypeptide [Prochloraceae cyanobacterium]